ncbi:hypothetical protein HCH52_04775 [Oscillospiraceae bacterium HV4-5-C5C]|nr:hypothetical protein [Oscillospiraceae bacterium HV4-5-C5C]
MKVRGKLLALLLTTAVVTGGCASKGGSSSEGSSAATQKTSSTAETTAAQAESESSASEGSDQSGQGEVTTFTYYRPGLNRNNITSYSDTLWVQELEKKMNVKIEFMGPASGDDYNQAVNIVLASGDYPDAVYMNWNNYNGGLRAAIDDGIVVDVSANETYKSLMPTWFGDLDENENLRRAVTLDDGTSALFCHIENNLKRGAYAGYGIRKDWLDNLGLQVPTTVDELYNVLSKFKTEDANGNGDNTDEIPMSDDSDHNLISYLAPAWGLRVNTPYLDPDTQKMTYWTQYKDGEAFTDFLTTLHQWYEEGLIDPEFASQDSSAKEAKITNDQVGFTFAWTGNYATWTDALAENFPSIADKIDIYGMVPVVGPAGKAYTANDAHVRYAASNEGTCVTSSSVKDGTIEAILKLFDYMYTDEGSEIINWGEEGVSYTKDADGKNQWTDAVTNDSEYSFSDKVFEYALPTWGGFPKVMSYDAWASIEATTASQQQAHENYWKADTGLLMPPLMMNQSEAEEYNQIMTDVNTAISELYLSVILGTKSVDDIPALLQQVDDMGINRAMEIYQGVYDRYISK